MTLKKSTVDGKPGWQWGSQGKRYTGLNAKQDAIKEGVVAEGPEKFSQKAIEQNISLDTKDVEAVAEWMHDNGYDRAALIATTSVLLSYVASSKTKEEWDKINKKELKRDTKKEKKEHEKDAIKEDKEKIKKLKKGDPSEKKRSEIKDLEKDKRYDKKDAKSASDKDEYRQDKKEIDSETLQEQLKHHKDAVKNLEREIKDLKKDKSEDEKDVRRESKGADLSTQEKNNLPDSDFAYIAPGGKKVDGKTEPRSLRHLPIPDAAHVRNALARLGQTDIPASAKKSALQKIKSAAKKFGIEVGG